MQLIKKLLKSSYFHILVLVLIGGFGIFSISNLSLISEIKSLLVCILIFIISLFIFTLLINKNRDSNLAILFFISGLISFMSSLLILIICMCCPAESYTKTQVYNPIQITRDTSEVRVIGKTQILRTNTISAYFSKNLKICKDEQYSAFGFRLMDNLYICKSKKGS